MTDCVPRGATKLERRLTVTSSDINKASGQSNTHPMGNRTTGSFVHPRKGQGSGTDDD